MKKPTTKKATSRTKRASRAKVSSAALATCPVNGAGWCPYPFSIKQLERRLKEKAEIAAENADASAATNSVKANTTKTNTETPTSSKTRKRAVVLVR